MHFYPEDRLAVFIDGANLYAASRGIGFDIDYRAMLAYFRARGHLMRAIYYTALVDSEEYSPIRPLVDFLAYNGYTMVTKPLKEFTDAAGRRRIKGNMDVELAIDMLEMAPHMDHAVLFSGDGDFRRLVEAVQRKGVRVTVISTIKTQPSMIADELRRQADQFYDLADLAPEIARRFIEPRAPRPVPGHAADTAPEQTTAEALPAALMAPVPVPPAAPPAPPAQAAPRAQNGLGRTRTVTVERGGRISGRITPANPYGDVPDTSGS